MAWLAGARAAAAGPAGDAGGGAVFACSLAPSRLGCRRPWTATAAVTEGQGRLPASVDDRRRPVQDGSGRLGPPPEGRVARGWSRLLARGPEFGANDVSCRGLRDSRRGLT